MTVTMTLTAVLQLVSPFAASQSHWLLFCSRLLFGACVSADKTFHQSGVDVVISSFFRVECSVLVMD